MRIIPKQVKIKMEFFKGIDMLDMGVAMVGIALDVLLFTSNLPNKFIPIGIVTVLFVILVFPFDEDDKAYMMVYNLMKFLSRDSCYKCKADAGGKTSVEDITPFTGIDDGFIEYGGDYYAVVLSLMPIEFRFMSESRQDSVVDKMMGAVLRTVSGKSTASMVKIDRPVIFDEFYRAEQIKLEEIKRSYVNGLLSEEELKNRVAIIYDRMNVVNTYNTNQKVYTAFHYLIFFDKNKNILTEQARNAIVNLQGADMDIHRLDDKELAVFLKYQYSVNFDEREIENIDKKDYINWIVPRKIEFTSRQVKYDGLITHNLRIIKYPTTVTNAWGYKIMNIPGTRAVMKIKPCDRTKSIKQIDRAIQELQSQSGQTGLASKQIEVHQHIDTLGHLLVMLQGDNEILFDTNIYITIYDYEMTRAIASKKTAGKNLLSTKQQIRRTLSEAGFKATDMLIQQFEAYASSNVSAYDALQRNARGIHSGSVAAAFPYVFKSLCDKGGFYVGTNASMPVFVNFFVRDRNRVNSNMVIIGKSGSGKSYATKTLLSNLAAEDSKIFILDPENEYETLSRNLCGKIIDVGSATQGRLNPFHIIASVDDEEESSSRGTNVSFNTHLQFLEEFFKQILPGIEPDSLEYLNNMLVRLYEAKDISSETDLGSLTPSDFPTFDDLYDRILADYQRSAGDYSKGHLRTLLNYVSKFATGGRDSALWNGEATISTNENFIVFNFQSLLANKNNTLANAQMLLVLKWLDNEIIKNRDYNLKYGAKRKIIVAIDEAHVFIDEKFPIALDFMHQLAKRIRKYDGMQIIITQNIKDFVGTEAIARKSEAIINACQYSFIFPLAPNDMHDLVKLYAKAGAINESEQEEIVNNGRGRAFVVTSPTERTCIDVVASPEVQEMFTQGA